MRDTDVFGRLGGAEFVVLLPQATLKEARVVAEKLRADVAAALRDELPLARALGVSAGVASGPSGTTDEGLGALVRAADQALYAAKAAGRHRVREAPASAAPEREVRRAA